MQRRSEPSLANLRTSGRLHPARARRFRPAVGRDERSTFFVSLDLSITTSTALLADDDEARTGAEEARVNFDSTKFSGSKS